MAPLLPAYCSNNLSSDKNGNHGSVLVARWSHYMPHNRTASGPSLSGDLHAYKAWGAVKVIKLILLFFCVLDSSSLLYPEMVKTEDKQLF